jgi:hypothetical protein
VCAGVGGLHKRKRDNRDENWSDRETKKKKKERAIKKKKKKNCGCFGIQKLSVLKPYDLKKWLSYLALIVGPSQKTTNIFFPAFFFFFF